ncbi:hypothetical protein C0Q70_12737 [Pomacea canaliculata]|uniref:Calponin-homology (CH) domain-containing protein n=1 Tax=Pomacea canaliculata TaxID=400727 RepID=A0A2T7P2B8_POMCA|nr:dixin-like [Pomacea canaliculata]PVD27575.1 hypothetical protein C0Q70_12737 [Pomacea canaliculata]
MESSVSSISPMTSPMEQTEESKTLVDPKQQLDAYIAWINSQLKKKTGVRPIQDLRNDMKDGINFVYIIEIVSGERIPGIHLMPTTYAEMIENVEKVLQFMGREHIKMHRISARDIVDGNLKAVMRLILALAAHYKPMSVRHSVHTRSTMKSQSLMGIAQGASAALTEARRNVKRAGRRHARSWYDSRHNESSSEPCSDSDQNYLRAEPRFQPGSFERRELEGASAGSSPISSCLASPRTSLHLPDEDFSLVEQYRSSDSMTASQESKVQSTCVGCASGAMGAADVEMLHEVKQQLMQLQDLILTNCIPEGSGTIQDVEQLTAENFVILKSQLQHVTLVSESLREEMSRMKNENLQLQGTRAGLQHRLAEQDSLLSQLKSEKLHIELELQAKVAENESLRKQLRECSERVASVKGKVSQEAERREQTISNLRQELMRRDQRIDQLQHQLKQEKVLRQELQDLHARLLAVGQTGATLSAKVARQDQRMAEFEGQMKQATVILWQICSRLVSIKGHLEMSMLQQSLENMMKVARTRSPPLDQLERSIINMLQNVQAARQLEHPECSMDSMQSHPGSGHKGGPRLRQQFLNVQSKVARQRGGQCGDGTPSTAVLYFSGHSLHPFHCLMPGRLGEIRLRDFKNLFEDADQYRYYFKALDPEYGTVKEELVKDEAVVPGWEDKIVAWVESEPGTQC